MRSDQHDEHQAQTRDAQDHALVHRVVHGLDQQQCHREDGPVRVPVPDDRHHGAANLNSHLLSARVHLLRGARVQPGHELGLVHAPLHAHRPGQVHLQRFQSCQHMEGACFLCTYRLVVLVIFRLFTFSLVLIMESYLMSIYQSWFGVVQLDGWILG